MASEDLAARSSRLRQELKDWEGQFAQANSGRKAGRNDIKADGAIAAKYKEYNKVREVLSGTTAPTSSSWKPGKRKAADELSQTPSKRQSFQAATPKGSRNVSQINLQATPSSVTIAASPIRMPAIIGPTPQKNGEFLGLFNGLVAETPSRRNRDPLASLPPNAVFTPSRDRTTSEDISSVEHTKFSRTPMSSGKQFLLAQFVTPRKRQLEEDGTPSSTAKRLATPAFLRRNAPLETLSEESESPKVRQPWKRIGMIRSLSSMIQSMRDQEEKKYDDDEDAMREMEMEADGVAPAKPVTKEPQVLVEDSQVVMPLGPDKNIYSDDDAGEGEKADKPTRTWKKKGQKRTTRRVNMRPVPRKAPTEATAEATTEDQSESKAEDAIAETQPDEPHDATKNDEDDDEADFVDDGAESDESFSTKTKKAKKAKAIAVLKEAGKEEPKKKRGVKKIAATAHANYQRLKIRGKGPKPGGGKGRFGRRK
ncbi:hypothetical protein K402DRAFT_333698 [Aulographum hederae CBS 113979]|uniref:DNA replication regulator SLD2 n=1 Tax=Aulographum hederae CBS 113979 TaxID=1176131 RepID=A0A6G1GYD1_9PEZI|nr:hypothetical protein K402DRAFT_333698 [Aulographum hederae CBS 113979]